MIRVELQMVVEFFVGVSDSLLACSDHSNTILQRDAMACYKESQWWEWVSRPIGGLQPCDACCVVGLCW